MQEEGRRRREEADLEKGSSREEGVERVEATWREEGERERGNPPMGMRGTSAVGVDDGRAGRAEEGRAVGVEEAQAGMAEERAKIASRLAQDYERLLLKRRQLQRSPSPPPTTAGGVSQGGGGGGEGSAAGRRQLPSPPPPPPPLLQNGSEAFCLLGVEADATAPLTSPRRGARVAVEAMLSPRAGVGRPPTATMVIDYAAMVNRQRINHDRRGGGGDGGGGGGVVGSDHGK